MIQRLIAARLLSAAFSIGALGMVAGDFTPAAAAVGQIAMFDTEATAQAHCPKDTGVWHEKGMRWYGRTEHGSYVCRKEAAAAGYRDTRNGQ